MKTIAQLLNVKEFPFIINDSNGNEIYWEDSEGSWYRIEYDSEGNEIHFENSNCNEIYCEDSEGSWYRIEYDSEGNEIYFENSEGKIEDNRNIPEYTMQDLVELVGNFKLKNKKS